MEDEIGAEILALPFFATEIGHKNVRILLKLAETLAYGLHVFMQEILQGSLQDCLQGFPKGILQDF